MIKKLSLFLFISINFIHSNEQPIFFTSIPKTGTHLLFQCLKQILNKKIMEFREIEDETSEEIKDLSQDFIFHNHVRHSEDTAEFLKEHDFIGIFIIRDPRDQIISLMHWIPKRPKQFPYLKQFTGNRLLYELINLPDCYWNYKPYLKWMHEPNFITLKFENLIGPKGGGTKVLQVKEIKKLAKHLKISLSDNEIEEIIKIMWGGTETFRKGQINSWKNYLKGDLKEAYKQKYGQLLIDLGYEKDFNW